MTDLIGPIEQAAVEDRSWFLRCVVSHDQQS